jgi:mRNA-degrading endonuclease toxin of MazEF toxin-antitoxin module
MYKMRDVVVIQFRFSNVVDTKKRPMLVLAQRKDDIIGCAITSNLKSDDVLLDTFAEGNLPLKSKVKYWQIHTILKSLVTKKVAQLSEETHEEVLLKINQLFQ